MPRYVKETAATSDIRPGNDVAVMTYYFMKI
jgi:hypothetical protein